MQSSTPSLELQHRQYQWCSL